MSLQGLKKEIRTLKKEVDPNHKTIEELLKIDPRSLTNEELFRIIQSDYPEFNSIDELTNKILEKMINGEYP
jgi:hypothetical protein